MPFCWPSSKPAPAPPKPLPLVGMSFEAVDLTGHERPDHALAPWNVWRPPGNWAAGRPFQSPPAVTGAWLTAHACPGCTAGHTTPAPAAAGCGCAVPGFWWAAGEPDEPVRTAMERLTGAWAPVPTAEIMKEVRGWCGDEAKRKVVVEALKDALAGGGDGAHKALYYLQCVAEPALAGLADTLAAYTDDPETPLEMARHAARYRDIAKAQAAAAAAEKNRGLWAHWQPGVGSPRCAWLPPPEEIGKPLPSVDAPKAPDGWQCVLFNQTILDIHAYCQNGYEWPAKEA